jgi:hypothetical protein
MRWIGSLPIVTRGLDPLVHLHRTQEMDCRLKPGNEVE